MLRQFFTQWYGRCGIVSYGSKDEFWVYLMKDVDGKCLGLISDRFYLVL